MLEILPQVTTLRKAQEPNWVVRGGIAAPQNLQQGYVKHKQVRGLFGLSVQHQPGRTVDELAMAGQFFNLQISFATDVALFAAAKMIGYDVKLVKSPGSGFHYTLIAQVSATGEVLESLPLDLATALSTTMQRRANPAPRVR